MNRPLYTAVLLGFLLVSCGEGEEATTEMGSADGTVAEATELSATLTGDQVAPIPVTTTASESATVTVNSAQTEIVVALTVSNITGVLAVHIHEGARGVPGGVIFDLGGAGMTTLTVDDFSASGTVTTFAGAVKAILNGNTYINVHTTAYNEGEIRGQIESSG